MFRPIFFLLTCILLAACTGQSSTPSTPPTLHLAVSANFKACAEELATAFTAQTAIPTQISSASSGKLSTQIRQGAPYHIFLSADTTYPAQLHRDKLAQAPQIYAYGRLILWAPQAHTLPQGIAALHKAGTGKIAIANPETAPYGHAAMQVLQATGRMADFQSRLVIGESIAQVNQYIESAHVDFGLTAYSAVATRQTIGIWTLIEPQHYTPIAQGATILNHADPTHLQPAQSFIQYLLSPSATPILTRLVQ